MAQAARLNLRMQKELKLLLTDPPPGASFPLLSPDSDLSSSSLSVIDAEIEGPEGTVYAKGIFKIKIQIPERYPFQPPIVTFATPIYHPNIDNGGRICLDILNLPPKGAWQPSLNISTVLTSIGLLLSEPNPDDGLMCEASREYKYNKQAFDQKARSMTEKYARAGARGNSSGGEIFQTQSNASMMGTKESCVLKCELDECYVSHNKLCGISRKLSLESSGSHQKKDCDDGVNEVPTHHLLANQMDVKEPKEVSEEMLNEYSQNHENPQWAKRKLSLESLGPPQTRVDDDKENLVPDKRLFFLNSQNIAVASLGASKSGQTSDNNEEKLHGSLPLPQTISHIEQQPQKDSIERFRDDISTVKRKKLGLTGKKLSLGPFGSSQGRDNDNKENAAPIQSLALSYPNRLSTGSTVLSLMPQVGKHTSDIAGNRGKKACRMNDDVNIALHLNSGNLNTTPAKPLSMPHDCKVDEKQQTKQVHDEEFSGEIKQKKEGSPIPESVIVLDSEDSEEESSGSLRSRLLLARKRLPAKWKAKA